MDKNKTIESIQRMIARIVATNPAGRDLALIGGFRLRLLDRSPRISADVDYQWNGDLSDKQRELVALFTRKLLPEVKREFGLDGSAAIASGPHADSAFVKVVELAFYRADAPGSRIEIPVDVTQIACLDRPVVRTRDSVVFLTVSEQDMVESKILAIVERTHVEARDMVDLFLFGDRLATDSPARIRAKLANHQKRSGEAARRLKELVAERQQHIRAIREIIGTQIEPETANRIGEGGGAEAVFDRALDILRANLHEDH